MSNIMPSSLANGRYQIGQLIGRGGMAQVYTALDTRLGRTVAVKMMHSDLANDDIFLSRFRREAHSVAQMNNPNIVNIYDSGEETLTDESGNTERVPYLVMEYVKGQTLRDIIKANGPLSQRDAEQVTIGVLNALEYSHRMGIIHRDIKPGNIMISEQGVVKVMDFGIARALDDSVATMTQSQGVVGTAQYLSPEQARGETVDMRSDLYSAGCVLYEMITGKPPFTGDSAVAIAYQHVSEVAVPPSTLVPGLPKMWDQICAKAMAKDRQNRYATAAEFKNDVLTFMNGGIPVAAAFNPLTDLANMKARKQAEQTAATEAMNPVETTATQAFNPVTGQFEELPTQTPTALKTRAQQTSEAKARKKKKIIVASIVASLAAIAVAGLLLFLFLGKKNQQVFVLVPSFSSATTEDLARQKLTEVGLKIDVKQDTNSTEAAGTFTKQSPKGRTKVRKGSTVTVWFSAGPKSVKIPSVKGLSQDEACRILKRAGFNVTPSTQTEDSADVGKDLVTRTSPAEGSSAQQGSTLMIYISSGMTKVPDGLVGQDLDSVLNILQKAGFNTKTSEEYSDSVGKGQVIWVDPDSGTSVAQRSSIEIHVSKGKEQVDVPNVTGKTYLEAKAILDTAGFKVHVTNSGSPNSTDTVTGQSPSSGQADKGSTINLTLTAGQSGGDDSGGDDSGGGRPKQ